jgi:hypothetical protein
MTTGTLTARTTKCSKPKGEYCKLHNPAPKQFKNIEDIFDTIDKKTNKQAAVVKRHSGVGFQKISETRKLAANVPEKLTEHIEQNQKEIEKLGLSDEEKVALRGYTGFAAGVCNNVLQGKGYNYYEHAPLWREDNYGPCDFVNREDLVDYMETIDKVLSTRQNDTRIVYRGIPIYSSLHDEIGASVGKKLHISDTDGLVDGLKEYYKVGKTFNYGTYLSTTHSASYAAERTTNSHDTKKSYYDKEPEIKGIMFEMKTNAGLDVTSIAGKQHAYEREVILPRDTHFKVVGVYVKPAEYDTVSGYGEKRRSDPNEQTKVKYTELAVVVQMVEVDDKGNEITHTKPHIPKPTIENIVAK